jgi:YD repeat-containing protein
VRGNRTSVIDPINGSAHPTTFTYDLMNRLTGITYPDNTTASFGYDGRGHRTSATDQNNKTTIYAYDDADRLTSVTDAATNLTQYNYDTEGNLTSITDGDNHTTSFAYDTLGRVTQTTFPSLVETYGYDQLYNLTSKTDRKNQTIQYVSRRNHTRTRPRLWRHEPADRHLDLGYCRLSPNLLQRRRSRALRIEIKPHPIIRQGWWWKHGLLAQPKIIYLVAQA